MEMDWKHISSIVEQLEQIPLSNNEQGIVFGPNFHLEIVTFRFYV